MYDIHCHLMYGVDDGPDKIEESAQMLQRAREQGIEAIILTPHYRKGMFAYNTELVERHYQKLKALGEKLGIQVYLGTEYHVNSYIVEYFQNGRCHTLGDTKFVLAEFSYETEFSYIKKMIQGLILSGYVPIVVHPERYICMVSDPENAQELQNMGAYIQCNADAVLGLEGRRAKRYCKKLLKNDWIDIIASDSHGIKQRVCHMKECYEYISKKYSEDLAESLFCSRPGEIIHEIK